MSAKKIDTKNPFNKGVTYADFLSNVNGKITVKSLLDNLKLSKDARNWIESELTKYKNK